MKVVLDTNVLLSALPKHSDYHLIFLALMQNRYELCITTDILNEYEEVFQRRANKELASAALDLIDILPNVLHVHKYFFWNLITQDPDDNKFVDCAIAAQADFIVTDDRHFEILRQNPFPPVQILSKSAFLKMIQI